MFSNSKKVFLILLLITSACSTEIPRNEWPQFRTEIGSITPITSEASASVMNYASGTIEVKGDYLYINLSGEGEIDGKYKIRSCELSTSKEKIYCDFGEGVLDIHTGEDLFPIFLDYGYFAYMLTR